MIQKGGLRMLKTWGYRPKRDFTWEQEPEAQRPALSQLVTCKCFSAWGKGRPLVCSLVSFSTGSMGVPALLPIPHFSSRCFVGVVGVRAFKLLQEDGCVDSSHMASTHLQQHDRTVEVRFE